MYEITSYFYPSPISCLFKVKHQARQLSILKLKLIQQQQPTCSRCSFPQTLLAEVSRAEIVPEFKNRVNVTFTVPASGTTGQEWSWRDRTKYDWFDRKYDESGGFQNVSGDLVAYMMFARPNDKDTARLFDWTTDMSEPTMKSVSLTLV